MKKRENVCVVLTTNQKEFGVTVRSLNLSDLTLLIPESEEEVKRDIQKAHIMFANPLRASEYINDAKKVVWMQSTFAGIDAMNQEGLRKDYTLTNVKDVYGVPIAEYVFAYILAFSRDLFGHVEYQKRKIWQQRDCKTLEGKIISILGTGSIGVEIAKKAKAFGMRTLGYNTQGSPAEFFDETFTTVSLKEFLSKADYVVSVLPRTKATTNIINAESISWMKDTATFMNVGRGNAVDEEDLIAALQARKIARAVLDVFKEEPLPETSPLWHMKNVYVTPHISGYIIVDKVFEIFEKNYYRFLNGEQLEYVVDFKKGY